MNTNTYLVTGAAGFIGSAVAKKLIRKGHKIVTIDNLSTGFEENIPDGVVFIKGNCSDEKVIADTEDKTWWIGWGNQKEKDFLLL